MELTQRQREVYDFIVQFRRHNGCSPSIPEIQRAFGIRSPNGVAGHLQALQAKGYIRRAARGSRQVDVIGETGVAAAGAAALHTLPVYGHVPLVKGPGKRSPGRTGLVTVDESLLGFQPGPECFVLQVGDDAMRDAGVSRGDLVVVEPAFEPREGNLVAAMIGGKSTLRRFVRAGGRWLLQAAHPARPEPHPRTGCLIAGVVRALIRRFD